MKTNKKAYPQIIILIASLLIIAVIIFALISRNQSSNINNKNSETNQSTIQTKSNNSAESVQELKPELYLSISQDPEQTNIRKEIPDNSTIEINFLIANSLDNSGNCESQIFKIEGVSANQIKSLSFNIINDGKTSGSLNLGEGIYRVDTSCNLSTGVYSKVFSLDLYVTQRTQKVVPTSYSI